MIYRRDKTAALKFQQSTPATHCLSRTAHHARLTAHHALLILLIMHWARLRIYQRPTEQPTDSYIVDISKNQNGSIEIPDIHFSNALPIMNCSSCTAHHTSCAGHILVYINERRASRSRAEAETILHKVRPSQILFDQAATKVRHIFSEFRLATKRYPPGVEDKEHPAPSMIFANKAPRLSTGIRPQCNLRCRISKQCIRSTTMEMQNDRNDT